MSVTPQNSAGVKKMKMPGAEKKMKLQENLGHNEINSITPEGRFWIVTYRTIDGTKEKSFNSEREAKQFLMDQDTDLNLDQPIEEQKLRSIIAKLIKEELNGTKEIKSQNQYYLEGINSSFERLKLLAKKEGLI